MILVVYIFLNTAAEKMKQHSKIYFSIAEFIGTCKSINFVSFCALVITFFSHFKWNYSFHSHFSQKIKMGKLNAMFAGPKNCKEKKFLHCCWVTSCHSWGLFLLKLTKHAELKSRVNTWIKWISLFCRHTRTHIIEKLNRQFVGLVELCVQ